MRAAAAVAEQWGEGARVGICDVSVEDEKAPSRMTPHRLGLGRRVRIVRNGSENNRPSNHLPFYHLHLIRHP
jgi:hypothetical protein